jgi:hypothetical protein
MSSYKLQKILASPSIFSCEVCGLNRGKSVEEETAKTTTMRSINEFRRDGTIKVHFSCSNHVVELFKQITKRNRK